MRILIAILSCLENTEKRVAQRETWLRELKGVDCRFVLGGQDGDIRSWRRILVLECPDALVFDCPDDYEGLSQKMRALTCWASDRYDFVFKCDDDTYIAPERLLSSGFEAHDYSGFIEDRDFNRAVNFPVYPHARGGPGYWLSRRAMEIVSEQMPDKRHQEDFAVGEALAQQGIKAFHDERYHHEEQGAGRNAVIAAGQFVSLHKVSPAEMRSIHALQVLPVTG